jgi:hypothetical protein
LLVCLCACDLTGILANNAILCIARKKYPPKDPEAFKALIAEILNNERLDRLKKYSFLYYLYKDMDKVIKPGRDLPSTKIVGALCLPAHFTTMMDGFYELDQHNFEVRIDLHPRSSTICR